MEVCSTTFINHLTPGLKSDSPVKRVGSSGQQEGRLEERELKIGRKDQGCRRPIMSFFPTLTPQGTDKMMWASDFLEDIF